jgi:hypothetical protein
MLADAPLLAAAVPLFFPPAVTVPDVATDTPVVRVAVAVVPDVPANTVAGSDTPTDEQSRTAMDLAICNSSAPQLDDTHTEISPRKPGDVQGQTESSG